MNKCVIIPRLHSVFLFPPSSILSFCSLISINKCIFAHRETPRLLAVHCVSVNPCGTWEHTHHQGFPCISLTAFLPFLSISLSSLLKMHISIISCQQLRATTTTSGRCFVPLAFKPQHAYFSLQSLSKRSCSAFADRPCDVSCCHW